MIYIYFINVYNYYGIIKIIEMKKLLLTVFVLIISIPFVLSQTFQCGGEDTEFDLTESIVISDIVCVDNGTPDDPSDDYFSFMVTTDNISSNVLITNLPTDIEEVNDFDAIEDVNYCDGCTPPHINFNSTDVTFHLNIPSPGCTPLNLSIDWDTSRGFDESCASHILRLGQPANIPTLQTWGLILLTLLFTIFGIIFIRQSGLFYNKGTT